MVLRGLKSKGIHFGRVRKSAGAGSRRVRDAGRASLLRIVVGSILIVGGCEGASWKSGDHKTAKEIKDALDFGRGSSSIFEATAAKKIARKDTGLVDEEEAEEASEERRKATDTKKNQTPPRHKSPKDYGRVIPPDPPPGPETLVLHGLAGYEVVVTYAKPRRDSQKLGYLRLGTRVRATKAVSYEGCEAGWHQLEDGAYVCASRGFVVGRRAPYMKYVVAPKKEAAVPYPWAKVRRVESPMWWRPPSDKEYLQTQKQRDQRLAKRSGVSNEQDVAQDKSDESESAPEDAAEGLANASTGVPDPEGQGAKGNSPAELSKAETIPLAADHAWLSPGNVVSLDRLIDHENRRYWHTARGGFIESKDVKPYQVQDFKGVRLTPAMNFPFVAFVKKTKAQAFREGATGKLERPRPLRFREFLPIQERRMKDGKGWLVSASGEWIEESALLMPRKKAKPPKLEPWEKWIDVDLSRQMLVAYEGERAVYLTLISSGDDRKKKSFATPVGRWRIYSKQSTSNMEGDEIEGGSYWLQDVPWVMYFHRNYALHGAFWHNRFGQRRSHGCVNLGPSDAKWLFDWTTPYLPENWHGVRATPDAPGTLVVVSRS